MDFGRIVKVIVPSTTLVSSKLGLALIFVMSFLFFLVVGFPYKVLKEYVSAKTSEVSGMMVRMDDMSLSLPLGVSVYGLRVTDPVSDIVLAVKKARVGMSLFSLFMAKLGANVYVQDKKRGELELYGALGILSAAQMKFIPSNIYLYADSFSVDQFAAMGMASAGKGRGVNPLIADFLKKIQIKGALDGEVDLRLNPNDLSASQGTASLALKKGKIDFDDSIRIDDQSFTKAIVRGQVTGGKFIFDKQSRFKSQQFELALDGDVQIKEPIENSRLNIGIGVNLSQTIRDQFSFIMPLIAPGNSSGKIKWQVKGTLDRPRTTRL